MRDHFDEFDPSTAIVVITFADAAKVADYADRFDVPFPIVIDPERSAYRSYGLGLGSFWRVWGPQVWRRYAQIFRADGFANFQRATDDTRQLGGDFVIAPDGTLAYSFWGKGPDDRPPVTTLVNEVRKASS